MGGEVEEVFAFPEFKTLDDQEVLVETCIKFLKTTVKSMITDILEDMQEGSAELAEKAVTQALISLCQEFINDPYFRCLKEACEEHQLQPVALVKKVIQESPD